ncbi:MAG: hypothetical protein AAFQ94_12690 [Bacteroidota bacterium]
MSRKVLEREIWFSNLAKLTVGSTVLIFLSGAIFDRIELEFGIEVPKERFLYSIPLVKDTIYAFTVYLLIYFNAIFTRILIEEKVHFNTQVISTGFYMILLSPFYQFLEIGLTWFTFSRFDTELDKLDINDGVQIDTLLHDTVYFLFFFQFLTGLLAFLVITKFNAILYHKSYRFMLGKMLGGSFFVALFFIIAKVIIANL